MARHGDDNLLTVISVPMLFWLLFIFICYVLLEFIIPGLYREALYKANGPVFAQNLWFRIAGIIWFILTVAIIALRPRTVAMDTVRLFLIIFSSVVLLALAVFFTGGFLDSPFSGAVSLYLGFFVLMSSKRGYRAATYFFILVTLFLMSLPYLYISSKGFDHILRWKDTPEIMWARVIFTMMLLIVAGYVGKRVSDEVNRFPT